MFVSLLSFLLPDLSVSPGSLSLQIPVGDIRTSDPYVILKIGKKVVGKTAVIRFTLAPEWKEEFHLPLLHLFSVVTMEIWDHDDVRPHKMLGKVEISVEKIPIDGELTHYEEPIQKGDSNIEPRGRLFFSASVKNRGVIIHIQPRKDEPKTRLCSSLPPLLLREFTDTATSQPIQDCFMSSELFTQQFMSWSVFRDLLYDVNQLSLCDQNPLNPPLFRRINHSVKFSHSLQMNLLSNTTEIISPQQKNSLTLHTLTERFILIPPNQYSMWLWVTTIKKFYLKFLLSNREIQGNLDKNFAPTLKLLYQYHHHEDQHLLLEESHENEQHRFYEGMLTLHVLGSNSNILCKCVLDSRTMILSCQDQAYQTDPPINISLVNLQSISVSQDFPPHQPYDLKLTIVSSKVSVTALADALKRGGKGIGDFEVESIVDSSKNLEPSEAGWHPGRIVVEGTKLTTKIVKTVVLGTIEGTSTIAKSTADLATTAAEGLVSIPIAAVGLSLQREEITTRGILNSPAASPFSTKPLIGIAPYWDTSTVIKLDHVTVQESNSFGVGRGPCGVLVHLLSKNENENNECFLGSKFIPYTQLIPKDSLVTVDDQTMTRIGGLRSNDLETTFVLDNEIAYRVDVVRGRNLLPPPQSDSISTILSHPLDSFVKLSTFATTTVGLTSPSNETNDRNPRISCSFVQTEGSPVSSNRIYKSPTAFNTLNPNWNHTFILSTADGLHEAAFIQLLVKDDSRSGEDHLMGVVYIQKEEFFSAQAAKGEIMPRTFPILPIEGMSSANLTSSQLGFLDVKLQLLTRTVCPSDKSYVPPEMTIRTEVLPSNEFSTSWLCNCTTDFQISRPSDTPSIEMERFYITMGYNAILLDPVNNQFEKSPSPNSEITHSLIESTLHQFQKKTSVLIPPSWDGTPPQTIETVEYHVFQNQRRSFGMWGSNFLHDDERSEFTDESGTVHCPFTPYDDGIDPPNGFEWEPESQSKWLIDREYTATDQEGWSYGVDFGWIMTNYREGKSSTIGGIRTCRRRRWKRIAKRVVTLPVTTVDVTATEREAFLNSLKGTDGFDNDDDESENEEDADDVNSMVEQNSPEILFELFENQRRSLTLDWGKDHLFRAERAPFSDEIGDKTYHYNSIESANEPPPGYEWVEPSWKIDKSYTNTDEDGWVYGIDFTWVMSNLKKGVSTISGAGRSVRRRKYTRRMKKIRKSINNMPQNISFNASRKSLFSQQPSARSLNTAKNIKDITTKLQAFNLNKDAIISLCKERETIFSSVVVPWNQILSCDVVTPTVLMVTILVHRYFGEDANKIETYRPAEVRVFILDCPAEKLSVLVYDRQRLAECRENISTLVSSGSIFGPNPLDDSNIYSETTDESNRFQLIANELSLGSSTSLYLEKELMTLSTQIDQLERTRRVTPSSSTSILTDHQYNELVLNELKHLHVIRVRIFLYITSLLEASLVGPSYDESEVKEMILRDYKVAEKLYHYLCQNEQSEINAAEQIVHFLLDTAEMRIRDTALCGWPHRGKVLESSLQLLVNGYYTQIVGVLGRFFESKEGLMSLQSNESKLQLIQFFVQHNSHFNNFVQSSLLPYKLIPTPSPLLSLCLDVNALISWYAEILANEMKKYVQNIFLASYQQQSKETYCLPWEVITSDSIYISSIPADTLSILTNYLRLVRLKTSSVPLELRDGLNILDERIRIAYVDCFLDLVTEYRNILTSHNWVIPLPKLGRVLDEESTFRALGMHIEWICSIANDCQHILDEHINACLEISFDNDEEDFMTGKANTLISATRQRQQSIRMSTQNQIELNESIYKLTKLLSSVITIAMDALSCLIFKSVMDILPTTNLYKTWKIHVLDPHKPSCIKELLLSLDSYLEEDFIQSKSGFHNSLEIGCLEKLVDLCLKKVAVWYLSMLRECYMTNISFNDDEIAQIRQDCILITEYFSNKIDHLYQLTQRNPANQSQFADRFQKIQNQLELFSYINILLTEEIGSPLFSKTCVNLSEISTHEKSMAYSHRQFLLILFKIRGTNSPRYDDILKGVDARSIESGFLALFDSSIQAFGSSKLPISYLVDPPPEILVFQLQANLEKYLISSTSKRLKKEQEINSRDEKMEEKSFLSMDHLKISLPKPHGFTDLFFKSKKELPSPTIPTSESPSTQQSPESLFSRLHFHQTPSERMNLILFPHIEAKNLYALDRPTDVYVSLQLNHNGKSVETPSQPNKLNPVWESNEYGISIAQNQIETSFIICTVFYKLKFRLLPLKVGTIRIPLNEILSNEDGILVINDYPLESNADVGTAKEILETLKSEDKHRQSPLLTILIKLNIVTKM